MESPGHACFTGTVMHDPSFAPVSVFQIVVLRRSKKNARPGKPSPAGRELTMQ
jgi:hypothetical protein